MRFLSPETEPQLSPVVSINANERPGGLLVEGEWENIRKVMFEYFRALRHGTVNYSTGQFIPPNTEMLAPELSPHEDYSLSEAYNFVTGRNTAETLLPKECGMYFKRLGSNRYWLIPTAPFREIPYTSENLARISTLQQSIASAYDLQYGVRLHEIEIRWGLGDDAEYRLNRKRLLESIQTAAGVEFGKDAQRAITEEKITGNGQRIKAEIKLYGLGREKWSIKGEVLSQPKRMDVWGTSLAYPALFITLHPNELVADVISSTSPNYSAVTFNQDNIETIREASQRLSDTFKTGSIL